MSNKIKNEEMETPDLLKTVIYINKGGILFLFFAISIIFIMTWIFKIVVPPGVILALLILTFSISFLLLFLYRYFPIKARILNRLENILTGFYLFHLLAYTIIIHYLGGVEWIGVIIYFFIIVEASILLSRKKALVVTLGATICYISLVFLEYFGILPHHRFFISVPNPHQNLLYLLFTITAALIGFHYCSYLIGIFSGMFRKISDDLRKERIELIKTQKEIEEAKSVLEIKVAARTKELQKLTESLEDQVKERTKELQGKVEELEKFNKLAINRELKMIELKKEIKKVKEELEKNKRR